MLLKEGPIHVDNPTLAELIIILCANYDLDSHISCCGDSDFFIHPSVDDNNKLNKVLIFSDSDLGDDYASIPGITESELDEIYNTSTIGDDNYSMIMMKIISKLITTCSNAKINFNIGDVDFNTKISEIINNASEINIKFNRHTFETLNIDVKY